jgi:SAM-dependent methyltransferase
MASVSEHHSHGVMDGDYARDRRATPVLVFRYQSRALVAADAVRDRMPNRTDVRVLELGAAEGRTLLHLRELLGGAGTFHGVELSDELLAQAPPLPANTKLFRGDVTALPPELEPASYDLVTALAVLEHLPDPAACAREAHRMLRPGGVFVATCPNPFWDRIAGRLGMVEDDAHEQQLDGPAMVDMLRAAGFTDIEYRPFMWAPVGSLPYLRVRVPPRLGLTVDRWVRKLRVFNAGFVNQAVVATKA